MILALWTGAMGSLIRVIHSVNSYALLWGLDFGVWGAPAVELVHDVKEIVF